MATKTADHGNAGSVPGPAYMVAVKGDFKAKTRKYIRRKGHVTSRYLRPKIPSCHDRCKGGVRDEPPELKKPGGRLGVRKMWVKKKPARRSVEPVERKKMTKTKPKPVPHPKICARDEPTNRRSTQNELKLPNNYVKLKPSSSSILNGQKNKKEIKNIRNTGIVGQSISAEQVATKGTHIGSLPRKHKSKSPRKDEESMTKAKLKQLLARKITEKTLPKAENAELDDNEDDDPRRLYFSRGKILDDNQDEGPRKLNFRRGKILDGNEDDGPTRLTFRIGKILDGNEDDGPMRLNFRRGKVLEDDENDSPTRLDFRKGTILEDNEDDESIAKMNFKKTIVEEATDDGKKESETVTLKHQEMQEMKEAQELLNRVIEETASKLEVDRKNKVEALVGAFESVISLRDNTPSFQ